MVSQTHGRLLGYVQVQVASRVVSLRVEALPSSKEGEPERKVGFYADDADTFGILVDDTAHPAIVQQTIERASVDAARHIARTQLN